MWIVCKQTIHMKRQVYFPKRSELFRLYYFKAQAKGPLGTKMIPW